MRKRIDHMQFLLKKLKNTPRNFNIKKLETSKIKGCFLMITQETYPWNCAICNSYAAIVFLNT